MEGPLPGQAGEEGPEAGVAGVPGRPQVGLLPALFPPELLPQGQGEGGGESRRGAGGLIAPAGDEEVGGGQLAEGAPVVRL